MGCAPSAATASATSPRVSVATPAADAATPATDGGVRSVAESTGADGRRRSYTLAADCKTTTRVNGDVPLAKASLPPAFVH